MGLLSALGRSGVRQLRSGVMFGEEQLGRGLLSRARAIAGQMPETNLTQALPEGSAQTGRVTRVYHATNREGFDVPTRDRTRRGEGISVSTNRDVAAEYGDRVIDLDLRGNYPDIASAEMEAVQRQWASTRAETGRTFEEELLAQGFDGYRDGDTIFVSRDNMLSRAQSNAGGAL